MRKGANRTEIICQLLDDTPLMTVKQLADALNVSEMTVRRDIAVLKERQLINVFFGGISLNKESSVSKQTGSKYVYENEIRTLREEKMRIARKAASLIQPNDVIFIDTGSTVGSIIDAIPNDKSIIIYSYALSIINSASSRDNLQVVCAGGYFHKNTRMFESEDGANLIRKATINKAFMATRGLSENGITTAENYEVPMKKAAINASLQTILLVDSSKIGKSWYAKYADLDDIDIIITDTGIPENYIKLFESHQIKVYIV